MTPPAAPLPSQPPSRALIDAEINRLAASAPFRRSPRHVRFLRHLIDATAAGDASRLREMVIGIEVFLRSAARFDPKRDTIVRVEARRLRQKLAAYYADEGIDARLEFVLPVGSYEIQVRRREVAEEAYRRTSVAVFELALHEEAAGYAPLAVSLSAELSALLTRLNGLRVVAAGAAPGSEAETLRHAAHKLKTDHAVLGRVAMQGTRLLLELKLLRTADGGAIWSRRAQPDPSAALQALEPLARGIIATLHRDAAERRLRRIQLAGSRPYVGALHGGGVGAEALELMGLARVAMRSNRAEGYHRAVQLAEQAVAAMPAHAPAFALLAEALIATVAMTIAPPLPTLEAARSAAERALALDPEIADAHGQLGFLLFACEHDWARAEPRLLEALRLAPASPHAHARYGFALTMNGRFAEARACYVDARDLDPLSLMYRVHDALVSYYERDWARADAGLAAVLDVAPQHEVARSLRASLWLCRGDAAAALEGYCALQRDRPALSIGDCGAAQALAVLGDEEGARTLLARLEAGCDAGHVSPYQVAMVHCRLGDAARSLQSLEQAAQRRDYNFVCTAVDPCFDALRGSDAFTTLLRAHGFAHLT